jgi:hypothetical protein
MHLGKGGFHMERHQKDEPKTAEEYRIQAQVYKKEYINQWKTFLKCGVFTLAALSALFLLSAAWFANNAQINTGGVEIVSDNSSFELKSYGKNGIYDDDLISSFFEQITVGDGSSPYATTGTATSISWLVSDESNLGNYSEEDVDFTERDRKDYAIEPGSEGKLSFFIIPGSSGTQTFNMKLLVTPFSAEVDEITDQVTSVSEVGTEDDTTINKYAKKFISGHVLFFLETESGDDTDMTWIKDESFEITIEDAVQDQEYQYTIYWKWPQVFSELILNEGDRYLNGRSLILNLTLREDLLSDMIETPEKYFYNSLTKAPLLSDSTLIAGDRGIADIHEKSPETGDPDGYSAQNFVDLSSFYNQADQIVGSSISFIMVELSAEEGGAADE